MTININTQHPEEAFLKWSFLTPAEWEQTEVSEMDGSVLWWTLRPFSERLSLATRTVDSWALNETSVWTKPQNTGKRGAREKRRKQKRQTVKMKSNPADSSESLCTRRRLCCRKCIQVTAKNRHTWCFFNHMAQQQVDHWFAMYVQTSQKRSLTPVRTECLTLKAAVFTFLSSTFHLEDLKHVGKMSSVSIII